MSVSVDNWVSRLKPSTGKVARRNLNLFMRWLKDYGGAFRDYSPDQLLDYQRNADNGHRYDVLDLVERYVLSMKGRKNSKNCRYTYIRSYFMHNRAELPRDRSFRIRGDEPMVRGDLSMEEARKIILAMEPVYQAVYLCMLQGGMGSHELLYWSNNGLGKLKADLKGDVDIIQVDLPGRKGGENERSFYTFLGGDAVAALRNWMARRPTTTSEAIFITQRGTPINYFSLQANWRRHMMRLGIGPTNLRRHQGRTGKSPHELRDLFRSQWAKSPAKPEVGEFMMGHNIDPLEYNKSYRDVGFYRGEYLKALPFLQILSSGRPFHQVGEEEVESLRQEVKTLRERIATISEARSESDDVMDRLFKDQRFVAMLKDRLREMK